MDRRDFLKGCIAAGIGAGLAHSSLARLVPALSAANGGRAFGAEAGGQIPDIVAVRGGEPDAMFDRGIAAMGGIGRFVKRGQRVAVKTNASWDVPVDRAGNTHPALVQRIVQHCMEAGAREVMLFDHTIEQYRRCLEASGLNEVARNTGAVIVPADTERYYQKTTVGGKSLDTALIHQAILEADVLISAPILKHHGGTGMTAGMKNFMGAVWDRRFFHRYDLSQCIADFLLARKPELTVIDAYRVVTGNGPRTRSAADLTLAKMQILSTDVVAADAAGARILGGRAEDCEHVRIAHAMGLGEIDPSRLPTRRITI
jgi:uncharacterized protein (DUF362 family)